MSRSNRSPAARLLVALGRAFVSVLVVVTMLAPSLAWAATDYSIEWRHTEFKDSCETAPLADHDGDAIFGVDGTPLPTYEVPGSYFAGSEASFIDAHAGFKSVLLRPGVNDFFFGVTKVDGDNSCVHSHEVANLVSSALPGPKLLFDVVRNGTAYTGSTQLGLALQEVNPQLARDLANLDAALAGYRKFLVDNASTVADLAAKQSILQELDTELHDLVNRPLDAIAQTDLDVILERYLNVVDPGTKAALEQVLNDLKKSVEDLRNELASLLGVFGAQADAAADLATRAARDAGWNPDDPNAYGLGAADVPAVDVPDISSLGDAFSPQNDPYAAYADKVIANLQSNVVNGQVTGRAEFVSTVRAWRANEASLRRALQQRAGVSQTETNAFLNGQNRVTAYVRQFMDAADWFNDSAVPEDTRGYIDGVLKQAFAELGDQLKADLNLWPPRVLSPQEQIWTDTINSFACAISAFGEGASIYGDVMGTIVNTSAHLAIGFIPVVGPALDLCEAVSGKEWCLPSGRELSDEQRIFAGAGVALGQVGTFWRGARNAAVSPVAIAVADDIAHVDEAVARGLRANPRNWYKTLRGAIGKEVLSPGEIKAGLRLQSDGRALLGIGDGGVRKMLDMAETAKAADLVSVTAGNSLAITEVKAVTTGGVDVAGALEQLASTIRAIASKGLAGDVTKIEIAFPAGASLAGDFKIVNGLLVRASTGEGVVLQGYRTIVSVIQF